MAGGYEATRTAHKQIKKYFCACELVRFLILSVHWHVNGHVHNIQTPSPPGTTTMDRPCHIIFYGMQNVLMGYKQFLR